MAKSTLGLFLIGGFLAGFLSLIVLIITELTLSNLSFAGAALILVLVIEEELIKFLGLNFLLTGEKILTHLNLLEAFLFGISFGLFEFTLLYFKMAPERLALFSITAVFAIHIITSIFLVLTIFLFKEKRLLYASATFLTAIVIHFIYNINIL